LPVKDTQRSRLITIGGKVAKTPDEAREIMRGLPEDRASATCTQPSHFWPHSPT